jgi:hypothetical protein
MFFFYSKDAGHATFGIRSRNIAHIWDEYGSKSYTYSPSTYGWVKDYGRVLKGIYYHYLEDQIKRGVPLCTITLICDEHRLSMIDENTKEQDEIEVDVFHRLVLHFFNSPFYFQKTRNTYHS